MTKPSRGNVTTLHGFAVIIIALVLIPAFIMMNNRVDDGERSSSGPKDPGLLYVQRQDAIKYVLKEKVLRDPDSASFSFEERGPNTVRVRVRHQNAFGGFIVQRFDITFPPGSVVANHVREVS